MLLTYVLSDDPVAKSESKMAQYLDAGQVSCHHNCEVDKLWVIQAPRIDTRPRNLL